MRTTLNKYILREIIPTFAVSLLVAVFILLATRMLSITEMIVNRGINLGYILRMLLYLLPDMITFALPATVLMSVTVAFLRLSSDNEIIALKSSGIGIYQLLQPALIIATSGLLISIFIGLFAVPWGYGSYKGLLFQIVQSQANMGIKERVFSQPFDNVTFYVNSFSSREKLMKDVFVVDRRDEEMTYTIVAKEGMIAPVEGKKMINLHFLNGTIFMVDKKLDSARSIRFSTYDLNIGLKDIMAALERRQKGPGELHIRELISHIKTLDKGKTALNEAMIVFLEKISMPLAVFFMGLLGVPLGAQLRSTALSTGIGVSLGVFMLYYLCLAGARSICETGIVSPLIGVFIPDIFLITAFFVLIRRAEREQSINVFEVLFMRLKRK